MVNPLRAGQNWPIALRDHLSACQYERSLTPFLLTKMISDKTMKTLSKAIIITASRTVGRFCKSCMLWRCAVQNIWTVACLYYLTCKLREWEVAAWHINNLEAKSSSLNKLCWNQPAIFYWLTNGLCTSREEFWFRTGKAGPGIIRRGQGLGHLVFFVVVVWNSTVATLFPSIYSSLCRGSL